MAVVYKLSVLTVISMAICPVSSLDCAVCERGTLTTSLSVTDIWATGNCSTYSLISGDVTACSGSNNLCLYRYEHYRFPGSNLTHVKRECTSYATLGALAPNALTSDNFTIGSCLIGADAEPVVSVYNSEIVWAGKSKSQIQGYNAAYVCLFEGTTGFVPSECPDGTIKNNCTQPQNSTTNNRAPVVCHQSTVLQVFILICTSLMLFLPVQRLT